MTRDIVERLRERARKLVGGDPVSAYILREAASLIEAKVPEGWRRALKDIEAECASAVEQGFMHSESWRAVGNIATKALSAAPSAISSSPLPPTSDTMHHGTPDGAPEPCETPEHPLEWDFRGAEPDTIHDVAREICFRLRTDGKLGYGINYDVAWLHNSIVSAMLSYAAASPLPPVGREEATRSALENAAAYFRLRNHTLTPQEDRLREQINEALASPPVPEPAAWIDPDELQFIGKSAFRQATVRSWQGGSDVPLYAAPVSPAPSIEQMCRAMAVSQDGDDENWKGYRELAEAVAALVPAPSDGMVEALTQLANEADGLSIAETEIRQIIGNTNWECLRRRIDEARGALSGKGPAPSVSVMALEWKEPSQATNGCWTADSPLGTYSIINEGGWYASRQEVPWEFYFEWIGCDLSRDTLATAKAAAQADFNTRISSALSRIPAASDPRP